MKEFLIIYLCIGFIILIYNILSGKLFDELTQGYLHLQRKHNIEEGRHPEEDRGWIPLLVGTIVLFIRSILLGPILLMFKK